MLSRRGLFGLILGGTAPVISNGPEGEASAPPPAPRPPRGWMGMRKDIYTWDLKANRWKYGGRDVRTCTYQDVEDRLYDHENKLKSRHCFKVVKSKPSDSRTVPYKLIENARIESLAKPLEG